MHIRAQVTSQWRHKVGSLVKFSHQNQGFKQLAITQELWQLETICKKRIDSPWNALSLMCPQIWPQVNSLGSRGHQRLITSFCGKITFAYCRFTKKDIEMKVSPSYSSRQAGSNDVWHDLERSIWKFDLRSRSWLHRNRLWCISLDAHGLDESIASG